jgi:hypothetical protein
MPARGGTVVAGGDVVNGGSAVAGGDVVNGGTLVTGGVPLGHGPVFPRPAVPPGRPLPFDVPGCGVALGPGAGDDEGDGALQPNTEVNQLHPVAAACRAGAPIRPVASMAGTSARPR